METEITEPVDLCGPDGRLNPAAVGWSRRPQHRIALPGWGRNKRFEYWCVSTPTFIVAANISNHDYRANISCNLLDLETGNETYEGGNVWLPSRRYALSDGPSLAARGARAGIELEIEPVPGGAAIRVESRRIQLDVLVHIPDDHEVMCVVVPWSPKRFQFTAKNNCLRVSGTVTHDGVRHELDPATASATYDRGRGRWPYRTLWNWGAGSGVTDGVEIGLNFGGKWTDGTGSTENSIRVDGRLHKISDPVEWHYDPRDWMRPWRVANDRVDLTFTPSRYVHHVFDRLIVMSRGDQLFGHWNGSVVDDHGTRHRVHDLFGHVEEVQRRW